MLARLTSVVLAFTLAASVLAVPTSGGGSTNSCNGGTVQCCNQVQKAEALDGSIKNFLGLLGVGVDQITPNVGLSCTAVNAVIGVGGGQKCNGQQVCCTGNNFNGVATLGCDPINVQV